MLHVSAETKSWAYVMITLWQHNRRRPGPWHQKGLAKSRKILYCNKRFSKIIIMEHDIIIIINNILLLIIVFFSMVDWYFSGTCNIGHHRTDLLHQKSSGCAKWDKTSLLILLIIHFFVPVDYHRIKSRRFQKENKSGWTRCSIMSVRWTLFSKISLSDLKPARRPP